jgi:hypothetical protein
MIEKSCLIPILAVVLLRCDVEVRWWVELRLEVGESDAIDRAFFRELALRGWSCTSQAL